MLTGLGNRRRSNSGRSRSSATYYPFAPNLLPPSGPTGRQPRCQRCRETAANYVAKPDTAGGTFCLYDVGWGQSILSGSLHSGSYV
jgi:hypothetical protein